MPATPYLSLKREAGLAMRMQILSIERSGSVSARAEREGHDMGRTGCK
jgi:hypothetical protein